MLGHHQKGTRNTGSETRSDDLDADISRAFGVGKPASRGPVGLFNVESVGEFERLDRLAQELGVAARVAVRVNPDVDAKTHPYTTTVRSRNKFGIALADAEAMYAAWSSSRADDLPGAHPAGLHMHIGSPVYDIEPFTDVTRTLVLLAARLRDAGVGVELLDLGGGWPSAYAPSQIRDLGAFEGAFTAELTSELDRGTAIHLKPGRSIIANNAVLLTRVEHIKRTPLNRFLICDAGMHALLRPALYYGAQHAVWPVRAGAGPFDADTAEDADTVPADVVGPICETGEFFATDRAIPEVEPGALLSVSGAGAYGMSMTSTYSQHLRPAEVLVGVDGSVSLIRRREDPADMLRNEAAVWA